MSKSNQRKKVFLTVVHRQIEFACEAIALTAFVSGILVDAFYNTRTCSVAGSNGSPGRPITSLKFGRKSFSTSEFVAQTDKAAQQAIPQPTHRRLMPGAHRP